MSETTTARKGSAFKRIVTTKAVAATAVIGLATGAAAAILITARVTGTANVIAAPTLTWTQVDTIGDASKRSDGSGITCAATATGGTLNVTIGNAMPGASCTIAAQFQTDAATPANWKVQNLDMGSLKPVLLASFGGTTAGTTSNGLVCGSTLPVNIGSTPAKVGINITVPSTGLAAGTYTIPASAGLTITPTGQYDDSLCTAK